MKDYATQLLEAYPAIPELISYIEVLFCAPDEDDPVTAWELLVAPTKEGYVPSPEQIVNMIRRILVSEIKEVERGMSYKTLAKCIKQAEHSQFLQYVAGKMGAV